MITAGQLITDTIPPVKTSDEAGRVLGWMNEFRVGQLPVVNSEGLLGMVAEEDLVDLEDPETPIGDVRLSFSEKTFVMEDSHFFDVLKMATLHDLEVLPVLQAPENNYLGLVTRRDLVNYAAEVLAVKEPGGIIVLEVAFNSYALSEIARLCEQNDAKILGLSLANSTDPMKLLVNLKLNIRELSRLLATFERFNYTVHQVISDAEQLDDFRDRLDNLLRYLNL
jgi:acetoin utilization protein AcuB